MVSYEIMRIQKLPEKYMGQLGLRIKLVRTYMRLEQKEFALKLKTAQSQISRIESGKTVPSLYHLLAIKKLADQYPGLEGGIVLGLAFGWQRRNV